MIKVAVLGATGTVGQKFIKLLQGHPQFRVAELVASEKSAEKLYKDASVWRQNSDIPKDIAELPIKSLRHDLDSTVLFSALDSNIAYEEEKRYATKGHVVISNTKSHRMDSHVPLVVPEVNHTHLLALKNQEYYKTSKGGIITNPNCAVLSFVLALAPLHKEFGVEKLLVQSMQAVSGAGYPGVASLDILGNVIPKIGGEEEEKIETEPKKILGGYSLEKDFSYAKMDISAHTNRVPVIDGHTVCVSLSFRKKPKSVGEIREVLTSFVGYPQRKNLHSAPKKPVVVFEQEDRPQPLLDSQLGGGMSCAVGRIRECNVLDYKFVSLSHNTVRGAAGCAILNAETAHAMGLFSKN